MICIVCLREMIPQYVHMTLPGRKMTMPFLNGYKCDHCRDMLTKQWYPENASLKEYNEYVSWQYQYDSAIEKYAELPEGYSFP